LNAFIIFWVDNTSESHSSRIHRYTVSISLSSFFRAHDENSELRFHCKTHVYAKTQQYDYTYVMKWIELGQELLLNNYDKVNFLSLRTSKKLQKDFW
jgi:hypothetical protein